ncbi:MAG TPA: phosphate ABC transporter permease PstA [Anaerolineales bacterium]|nr:phosphate ABC transporter permease PstA [Anaerolineales bacterium]
MSELPTADFRRQLASRKRWGRFFAALCLLATIVGLVVLTILLADVFQKSQSWLDTQFLTSFPSRRPEKAGILSALVGSIWLVGMTAIISFPVGVAAAIYLEEYAPQNWVTSLIQTNLANLAGVPSIVYGLLGLAIFVRALGLGRSLLAGALTMGLLILPTIIIAAREAIRAVPPSLRHASLALGGTRWQTVRGVVLPLAFPGILTGTILALSRAIGETAPLITIGALTYIAFLPDGPMSPFTVLPIQIFNWTSRPQEEFRHLAAAGIVVLLIVLLSANAVAILLRDRLQKRY